MSISHRRTGNGPVRHRRETGQSLVEFALVFPIFIAVVMGLIEFSFVFNGLLSIGHATRDAALVAAEAGNSDASDCLILNQVEKDISAPANPTRITQVVIYRADQNGAVYLGQQNVYTRTGSKSCDLPDGSKLVVPYSVATGADQSYPPSSRCSILSGTGGGCLAGHSSVDTIGVKVTYQHTWITPLASFLSLGGPGATLVQSNAMRMEPVL